MKIYYKTHAFAKWEVPFLRAAIRESAAFIDNFLLLEFNYTHTGHEKDFELEDFIPELSSLIPGKFIYMPIDLRSKVNMNAISNSQIHENEQIMRNEFRYHLDFNRNDIIISTDADEVIYANSLGYYIELLNCNNNKYYLSNDSYLLNLNQFFYKMNYFWVSKIFTAPTIGYFGLFRKKTDQWRYRGTSSSRIDGCHFSWMLSPSEMIEKLSSYSHSLDYSSFMDKDVLSKAIENKTYPFDPTVDFKLADLTKNQLIHFLPTSIAANMSDYAHLFSSNFRFDSDE